RNDPETAARLLHAAVRDFEATGQVLAEGRSRLALAEALHAVGLCDEAAEHIGKVKQSATVYGVDRLYTLAVNTQRRLGALGRRSLSAGTSTFSVRERSIAELACQ